MSGAKKQGTNHKSSNLEVIKIQLLERKAELEGKLSNIAEKKGPSEHILDVGDQVQSISMESLAIALQDTEIAEYNNIVKALEKIDEGTYGLCVDCGQPISEKRLQSFPNASRCLACQELKEEQGL